MKKLLLLLLIPVLSIGCKKDDDTNPVKQMKYTVTGTTYNITVKKGSETVSTAVITGSGSGTAQTVKDYSFTANKGDVLDFAYTNTGSLKVQIFKDGDSAGNINVGTSSSGTYQYTVD